MSSTNVHSKSEKPINIYCVCGQSIPKENGEIEMPPKVAQKGPSTIDVIEGPEMEIPAGNSELRADGKIISGGKVVATLEAEAYEKMAKKHSKDKENSNKGNDR